MNQLAKLCQVSQTAGRRGIKSVVIDHSRAPDYHVNRVVAISIKQSLALARCICCLSSYGHASGLSFSRTRTNADAVGARSSEYTRWLWMSGIAAAGQWLLFYSRS